MMKQVCSFSDLKQLIDESTLYGYKVCLADSTINHDNWPSERFFEYIATIEYHKEETNAMIEYKSLSDANERVIFVDVFIHLPKHGNQNEREYRISWEVIY